MAQTQLIYETCILRKTNQPGQAMVIRNNQEQAGGYFYLLQALGESGWLLQGVLEGDAIFQRVLPSPGEVLKAKRMV